MMVNLLLLYIGAVITFLWGVAHLFPTKNVVKGFGDISADNKNIITMEWIIEGAALIFMGIIIAGVTIIGEVNNVTTFVYVSSSVFLIVLAIISLFTGFKVKFLPFKLCPVLFTLSAVLILIGYFA
jgi:predicted RND superfamily exporter protein